MSRSPVVQDELGLRTYGILGSRNGVTWGGNYTEFSFQG